MIYLSFLRCRYIYLVRGGFLLSTSRPLQGDFSMSKSTLASQPTEQAVPLKPEASPDARPVTPKVMLSKRAQICQRANRASRCLVLFHRSIWTASIGSSPVVKVVRDTGQCSSTGHEISGTGAKMPIFHFSTSKVPGFVQAKMKSWMVSSGSSSRMCAH